MCFPYSAEISISEELCFLLFSLSAESFLLSAMVTIDTQSVFDEWVSECINQYVNCSFCSVTVSSLVGWNISTYFKDSMIKKKKSSVVNVTKFSSSEVWISVQYRMKAACSQPFFYQDVLALKALACILLVRGFSQMSHFQSSSLMGSLDFLYICQMVPRVTASVVNSG